MPTMLDAKRMLLPANLLDRCWRLSRLLMLVTMLASGLVMFVHAAMAAESAELGTGLVAIPSLTQHVTDLTGSLNPQQQAALEGKLTQIEQQKGSQVAVLIVPTTQPEDIAQYSMRAAEAWKIGRKGVDDGVLVTLALNDRKIRIEVGYGLEGAIPDIYAKRIISENMAPFFTKGDVYGGLNAGVDKLSALISGESLPAPKTQRASRESESEHLLPLLLFGGLIAGGLLRAIFGSFLGGAATGGLIGVAAVLLGGSILLALVLGFIAFMLTMSGAINALGGLGGIGGGGFGSSGGDFSGGGGGFGGGGASGDW